MANVLVWVDIPVTDLDRAIGFYSAVLAGAITKQEYPGMAIGCLHLSDHDRPSEHGPLIYLSCQGRLDEAVTKVEPAGGKILKAKHEIGPYGFRALVLDSEGNRIALHSM
jgi:predicted enzyme related to lactoylglutathione lyase